MKALLITNLYPSNKDINSERQTKALHNIVKYWDIEVEVIKTNFIPTHHLKQSYKDFFQKQLILDGINIEPINLWKIPKYNHIFYGKLINHVLNKKNNPHVIISHRLTNILGSARLAHKLRIPLITGLHYSDILDIRKNGKEKYNDIFDFSSLIACRSLPIMKEFLHEYPDYKNKCFIAYSGIEKEIIVPIEQSLLKLKEWKSNMRPIRFVTVSSLIKRKNIEANLRSLAKLNKEIDWEYTIIGEGELLHALKSLSIELNIASNVLFIGWKNRSEVINILQESDIFILVSAQETFGISYLEALATGCLVIGSYNSGIDGIIENNKNGFLCEFGNVENLNNILITILAQTEKKLELVLTNAYNTIQKFTEEKAALEYQNKVKSLENNYLEKEKN